jgi:hypothetical protein
MEELNNLLPNNNDNNNNNNNIEEDTNNDQLINRELESDDYQIIIFNSLPSSFYCIIISIILFIPFSSFFNYENNTKKDFSQISHLMSYLKIMLILYIFYIMKALFYYFIETKKEIDNIYYQILITLIYFMIDIFYYIATVMGYFSYQRLSLSFIINNIYKCIFIYCLIFIGIVHICLFFLSCFYILLTFIFSLNSFFDNEMGFLANQGEIPNILEKLLHTEKADSQHCKECLICLENIEKGDEIIILKCHKSHFFHSKCIKKWLKYNVNCPLCKKQNIL